MNHNQLQTLLAAYSQLDEAERRLIDAHVLQCAECAAQLRVYQQMDRRLNRLVDEQIGYAARQVVTTTSARQPTFITAKRSARSAWLDNLAERLRHPPRPGLQRAGVGVMALVVVGFFLALVGTKLSGVTTTIDALLEKVEQAKPTPISSTEKVTITFACHHASCNWFKAQAQAFQQQHPNIEVVIKEKGKFVSIGTDGQPAEPAFPEIAASVDSGEWWQALYSGPIPMSSTEWAGVRNLRPFIQADPTFPEEDFFLAAQQYLSNEFVSGLPANLIPPLVIFDKTLFDAVGVPYPRLDWKLDDLYAAAQQTTVKRGAGCCIGFGDNAGPLYFPGNRGLHLLVIGDLLHFLREQQNATPAEITQLLGNAIQRYTDLVAAGAMPNLVNGLVSHATPAMWTAILAGEGTAEYSYPGSKYGFAPLPQEMQAGFPARLGIVYYISAQSQHPQESWLWLKFLAGQVNPHDIAPPARRSTAENHYFNRRGWDAGQVAALQEVLRQPGSTPIENSMAFSAIRGTINGVIENVLKGQSVEEALGRLQKRLTQEITTWQAEQLVPVPVALAATPTPQDATQPTVTITFACHDTTCTWYSDLASEFQRQHPTIRVDVRYQEMPIGAELVEFFRQTSAAVDSGIWFDPVEEMGPWEKPINEELAGMLTNLAPLMAGDPSFDITDFYPVARTYLERKGDTVWSLPIQLMPLVIAYNRDSFRKADVPYPTPGWTLADFYTTTRRLARYEGGQLEQYGFVDRRRIGLDRGHHLFVLDQLDGFLQAQSTPTATANFPPGLVDAIHRYTDLALPDGAMPNPTTLFQNEKLLKFAYKSSGAAMWTALYGHDAGNTVGIVPLPQPLAAMYPVWLGRSLYISKQSRYPEESWLWLKFVSEKEAQVDGVPARRSVAEQLYWSSGMVDRDHAAILRPLVEQSISSKPYPEMLLAPLNAAIDKIFAGTSVETALADAQPAINFGVGIWRNKVSTPTPFAVVLVAPPTPTPQPTVVPNRKIVTVGCPDLVCSQFRDLAEHFERLYPTIDIQVLAVQPGISALELSKAADVLVQWKLSVTNTTLRENFANLRQDFIDQDAEFGINDYYPGALELYHWEDGLWMLPSTVDPPGILYDKAAFAQAGLPPPALDWTREEFLATARQLTQRQGDSITRYGFANTFDEGMAFIAGAMREVIAPTTAEGPVPSAKTQIGAALDWYVDLARKEQVMPPTLALAREAPAAMWLTGLSNALMWPQFMAVAGQQDLTVGLAPLPGTNSYPLLGGNGPVYLLSKAAKHPWESWLWLKFLTKQRIEKGVFPGGSLPFPIQSVPARRSVAAKSGYWNHWDPADRAVIEHVLEHAQPGAWGQFGWQRWQRINQSIQKINAGTSVDEALAWLDDCPNPRGFILEPEAGAVLSGTVTLIGSADSEHFQYYMLEYTAGNDDPAAAFNYFSGATTPVIGSGQLGLLDTTTLPDGEQTLRLIVVDKNGNTPARCRVPVIVKNNKAELFER